MTTHQIGSLAHWELVSELRTEIRRLRWSVWVRVAAIRALEGDDAGAGLEHTGDIRVRRSALLARQHAELDRIAEIERTLAGASEGRISRCELCGAPLELEGCRHGRAPSPGGRTDAESRPLAVV